MQVPLHASRIEARTSVLALCTWLVLVGSSLACSRGASAPAPPPRALDIAAPPPPPPPPAPKVARPTWTDPITVPRGATFRDLVARARDAAPAKRPHDCLVREDESSALVLEALDVGEGDFADPPDDLDALLDRNAYVAGDKEWGTRLVRPLATDGGNYLDLVALTPVPRLVWRASTLVLVVTDRALYLGTYGTVGFRQLKDLPPTLVTAALAQAAVWIVAAEGAAPLARVQEALDTLREAKGSVVLATPLPTPEPRGPAALTSPRWPVPAEAPERCRPGAYESAAIQPRGDYEYEHEGAVLGVFERAASSCRAKLAPGAGGSLDVRALIRPDGTVEDACIDSDDALDSALRSCLADAVRNTRFPPPDKRSGWVNFGTRLAVGGPPIRGACNPRPVAPAPPMPAPATVKPAPPPARPLAQHYLEPEDVDYGFVTGGVPGGVVGGVVGTATVPRAPSPPTTPKPKGPTPFSSEMTRPTKISGKSFDYTQAARAAGVEGTIIARCVVTAQGAVTGCRVIKSLPLLDQEVLSTLQSQRYTPALLQGRALDVEYNFAVRFRLDDSPPAPSAKPLPAAPPRP